MRGAGGFGRAWSGASVLRRGATGAAALVCALGLCLGAYAGLLQLTGNFHVVVAGELYRSAQPGRAEIFAAVRSYGIRTIVNLRGASEDAAWYRDEIGAAAELGLTHVDFKMKANRVLTPAETAQLVAILKDAPKPILVHCRSGSDRTGLAAALYLAAVKKAVEAQAEAHLSLAYGHFSIPATPAFAMDETFEALEPSLGYQGS